MATSNVKRAHMDTIDEWRKTLTEKQRELHDLAAIMLKKELKPKQGSNQPQDTDNGSYFPDKCHAFRSWLKAKDTKN
jgi:hypothetical protein